MRAELTVLLIPVLLMIAAPTAQATTHERLQIVEPSIVPHQPEPDPLDLCGENTTWGRINGSWEVTLQSGSFSTDAIRADVRIDNPETLVTFAEPDDFHLDADPVFVRSYELEHEVIVADTGAGADGCRTDPVFLTLAIEGEGTVAPNEAVIAVNVISGSPLDTASDDPAPAESSPSVAALPGPGPILVAALVAVAAGLRRDRTR